MTRDEYLGLRGSTSYNLLYEYYREKYNGYEHQPFLDFMEFVKFMQMWPGIRDAYSKVLDYYDGKFNVKVIMDKEGNTIGYS